MYDKAKYHYDGDYPKDLPVQQAFVHTGLFLGWVIERSLYSEEFKEAADRLIPAFKGRETTGPKVFEQMDGVLTDADLNEEGNRFAQYYFDFTKGQYLTDYENVLASGLPSLYHVQDTWENYKKMKHIIDQRYQEWKRNTGSR